MTNLYKISAFLMLIQIILVGCDFHCKEVLFDTYQDKIPDSVLNYLPYKNGDVVDFINSDDIIISYQVTRETKIGIEYLNDECSVERMHYEQNQTDLNSVDSKFDIRLIVSNYIPINTYLLEISHHNFRIPVSENSQEYADVVDSMLINNVLYYNVFIREREAIIPYYIDSVQADTIFYNYEFGILEIDFTDGETYRRID